MTNNNQLPPWLAVLTKKDLDFIRQFIISSGSLKEMASYYDISYPTVRLRLDKLIQKVSGDGMVEDDNYIQLIRQLALDGKMSYDTARELILSYRKERRYLW